MTIFVQYKLNMTRFFYTLIVSVFCCSGVCRAQFSAVVLDLETKRQVAGVYVYINPKGVVKTDGVGRFVIDGDFNSITLTRQGYESLTLSKSELCDSIWLLPNGRSLDEVVIVGHKPKINFKYKNVEMFDNLTRPKVSGLDLMSIFDFKGKKKAKRRNKIKKILDNY